MRCFAQLVLGQLALVHQNLANQALHAAFAFFLLGLQPRYHRVHRHHVGVDQRLAQMPGLAHQRVGRADQLPERIRILRFKKRGGRVGGAGGECGHETRAVRR